MSRLNCPKCQLTTCALCARNYLGKTINVKGKQPHKPEVEKFPTDDAKSSTSYQPPHDAIIGPAGKGNTFYGGYGEYHNSQWTLPPAWTESGVMLILPVDPGLWSDVISRWVSITINRLNSQTWSNNKAKLAFVENLLGESKKLMWQQWRTAYPGAYSALETIADDPQNITSQVRQLIIMEDPYRGSTDEQDRAYRDLKCAKIEVSCCRCNIVSLKVKTNGKFGKKEMKVQLILHRWMYKY
ncbi:hypothetical protein Tco_1560150 [Tanacetum coccineum]